MTVKVGDTVPAVTLPNQVGEDVTQVNLAELCAGKKVVLFGLPGAYTSICSMAHLPSFIRTADAFRAKGIDAIVCVAVNDVRVMKHWGESSGAVDAGIMMLADWNSELTKAFGLEFSVPAIGFKDRMTRCAMYIEDGVVKVIHFEEDNSTCDLTGGESLLEAI